MAQRRESGAAYLQVDGTTIYAEGSFAVPLTTVQREALVNAGQVIGWDETEIAPYITAQIRITSQTDFESICNSTALTVRVEFASGRVYTLSNAYITGDPPTLDETGLATVTFTGETGVWN